MGLKDKWNGLKKWQKGAIIAVVVVGGCSTGMHSNPAPSPAPAPATATTTPATTAKAPAAPTATAPAQAAPVANKDKLHAAVAKKFGAKLADMTYTQETGYVRVEIKEEQALTADLGKWGVYIDLSDAFQALRESGGDYKNAMVVVSYPLTDKYGNLKQSPVYSATLTKEESDKINLQNWTVETVKALWIPTFVHPAMQ